jgi:hypothetical protein
LRIQNPHHSATRRTPTTFGAIRRYRSATTWKGLIRLAKGMNHQPIAQRGVASGVPPPRAGTLSTERDSHARNAIPVAM